MGTACYVRVVHRRALCVCSAAVPLTGTVVLGKEYLTTVYVLNFHCSLLHIHCIVDMLGEIL